MKKFLAQVTGALAATQFMVGTAVAALPEPDVIPGLEEGEGVDGIIQAILDIIAVVLNVILLIAVVFVIVAGIRLIVSGGDETQKDKAKQAIIYVVVGIIVVLFARVLVSFVNSLFEG